MKIKDYLKKKTSVAGLDINEAEIRVAFADITVAIATPEYAIKDGRIIAPEKIARALKQLWSANKIKTKNVSLAVHGQDLLLHIVTIPYARPDEICQVLETKVNQYVAFAGVKTAIAWDKVGEVFEAGEKRSKFLLAVARRDLVDSYINAVELAGLLIHCVVLSPLASWQALKEGSLKSKGKEKMIFINVDEQQTFVLVLEGNSVLLTHNLALGAQVLAASPEKLAVLAEDLQKILHREQPIAGVVIHADNSLVNDLVRPLGEGLGQEIKVEYNKTAAGLAQSVDPKINLLPLEVKKLEELREHIFYFLFALTGVAALMIVSFFLLYFWSFTLNNRIEAAKAELSKPSIKFTRLKEVEEQSELVARLIVGRRRMVEKYGNFYWDNVFNELTELVPESIFLSKIDVKDGDVIIVDGLTAKSDNAFDFIQKLKTAKNLKKISLQYVRDSDEFENAVNFSIYAEKGARDE